MKVTFGMYLDGALWNVEGAVLGQVRTGPGGLLGLLETRLGIPGPTVHPVHRIDGMMRRMETLREEIPWYGASFAVDAWSTARQMLQWRDELVESGWQKDQPLSSSPRLDAISRLERSDLALIPGNADRLWEVIGRLAQGENAGIEELFLVEPVELLPPAWQTVMELLVRQGTRIAQEPERFQASPEHAVLPAVSEPDKPESNLSKIKAVLRGLPNPGPLVSEDESLILAEASDEWEAAENLALWLAADKDQNRQVAIICGLPTTILDQAFARHNLPRLGRAEPSRWREVQQILPLMLANAWSPVDIRRVVELLSLSIPPYPRWACQILLRAIAEEPGTGGKAWESALGEIREKRTLELVEKGQSESDAAVKAEEFVQEIQSLLVQDRFDPAAGIPEERVKVLCQKVVDLLGWQLQMDSRLRTVIGHARELSDLSTGKWNLPRTVLERILDTVIGVGTSSEDSLEEAGACHVVDHPGQLLDSWDTVLWWGFNDIPVPPATYWSGNERAELEAAGINPGEPGALRDLEAFAWQQGLMAAKERFVAVTLKQLDGEPAYPHPYRDTLWCAAARTGGGIGEDAVRETLVREWNGPYREEKWSFAGRSQQMDQAPAEAESGEALQERRVPENVIGRPRKLSYSQMNTFIGCPFKWALEYYAGLRLPESQSLPSGNRMIGLLCHRIVEELYTAGNRLDTADAVRRAEDLYDSLLPSMASELLLDGNAVERQRYRRAVTGAVGRLVQAINERGLRVERTEAALSAELDGIPFIGFADMILRDEGGKPYVLDLKWSYTDKHYKQSVELGTALQLSTYAFLLRAEDPAAHADAGYFLLAQGKLFSDSTGLTDEPLQTPHSLDQTWEMGVAAFRETLNQLDQGILKVLGVSEEAEALKSGKKEQDLQPDRAMEAKARGILYQAPPCRFCEFGGICGRTGGAS